MPHSNGLRRSAYVAICTLAAGCTRFTIPTADPVRAKANIRGSFSAEVEANPRAPRDVVGPVCATSDSSANPTRTALLELMALNAAAALGYSTSETPPCGVTLVVSAVASTDVEAVPGELITTSHSGGSAMVLPVGNSAVAVGGTNTQTSTVFNPPTEKRTRVLRLDLKATNSEGMELWRGSGVASDYGGPEVVTFQRVVSALQRKLPKLAGRHPLWDRFGFMLELVTVDGISFVPVITSVKQGSVAERAWLALWDQVLSVNGNAFTGRTGDELVRWLLGELKPGAVIEVLSPPPNKPERLTWPGG